jgi:hypothetical protein
LIEHHDARKDVFAPGRERIVEIAVQASPKLVGDDLKTYSTIADLIDPRVGDDAVVNPGLPGWPRWELFDLVVLIAVIMAKRFIDRARLRKVGALSLPDWHANLCWLRRGSTM